MTITQQLSAGLMACATLLPAPLAHAAAKPPRVVAFAWAKTQAGKPYIYGGTGPKGYDCSGLVYAAYKRVGFTLPRTTEEMLDCTSSTPASPGPVTLRYRAAARRR